MVATGLCSSCRILVVGSMSMPPTHCFGTADQPAPDGVMGGFRCSCPCRNWERKR